MYDGGRQREGTREIGAQQYDVVLGTYLRTRKTNTKTRVGSAPVPHHKLSPSEHLPRATVPRHDADTLADSPLASSQLYLHRAGKVDARPER